MDMMRSRERKSRRKTKKFNHEEAKIYRRSKRKKEEGENTASRKIAVSAGGQCGGISRPGFPLASTWGERAGQTLPDLPALSRHLVLCSSLLDPSHSPCLDILFPIQPSIHALVVVPLSQDSHPFSQFAILPLKFPMPTSEISWHFLKIPIQLPSLTISRSFPSFFQSLCF